MGETITPINKLHEASLKFQLEQLKREKEDKNNITPSKSNLEAKAKLQRGEISVAEFERLTGFGKSGT